MRAGHDWQTERLRYLVHFSGGGSGMRYRETKLDAGDVLTEGAQQYTVERVEQPPLRLAAYGWDRSTCPAGMSRRRVANLSAYAAPVVVLLLFRLPEPSSS
jgi:hypothetical protein